MTRAPYRARTRNRLSIDLEHLEHRQLLAGLAGVVGTTSWAPILLESMPTEQTWLETRSESILPAVDLSDTWSLSIRSTFPDAQHPVGLNQSTVNIEFDRPIYDLLTFDTDFAVIGDQGYPVLLMPRDPGSAPENPNQLTFDLEGTLSPGHYRLVLLGSSPLSAMLAGSTSLDSWSDNTLSEFDALSTPVNFGKIAEVSVPTHEQVRYSGTIDPVGGANPAVLFRFDLNPDHAIWRLGIELEGHGALISGFSLFDSTGRVIATRESGTGLAATPNNPYLFIGLPPGSYAIGVTGAGHLSYPAQGEDGTPGSTSILEPFDDGGAFILNLVADPADQPVRVTGFTLDRADPSTSDYTGVTLSFSDGIDLNSLVNAGQASSSIEVVDSANHVYPAIPTGYDAASGRLTIVFDRLLPPGHYRLIVPESAGLTDLSGQTPVGPDGTTGVLASWDVNSSPRLPSGDDLGVLWPSDHVGFARSTEVNPGQSKVYRIVIPTTGVYMLSIRSLQGDVAIGRLGPDGWTSLGPASNTPSSTPLVLHAGTYYFSMTTDGGGSATLIWTLRPSWSDPESLLDNGVGPNSALSLGRVVPASFAVGQPSVSGPPIAVPGRGQSGTESPPTPDSGTQPGAGTTISPGELTNQHSSPGSVLATSSPGMAALTITPSPGLLGRPALPNPISPVGPAVSSTTVTLANSGQSLLPGIDYGIIPGGDDGPELAPTTCVAVVNPSSPISRNHAGEQTQQPPGNPDDLARFETGIDLRELARADRLAEIVDRLGGMFFNRASSPPQRHEDVQGASLDKIALTRAGDVFRWVGDDGDTTDDGIQQAHLGVPMSLILASALAYKLRHAMARWCNRPRPLFTGPHRTPGQRKGDPRDHQVGTRAVIARGRQDS